MHLKDKPSFCKALLLEAVGQTFKGHTAVGHEQAQGRQQEPELLVCWQTVHEQAPEYLGCQFKPVSQQSQFSIHGTTWAETFC